MANLHSKPLLPHRRQRAFIKTILVTLLIKMVLVDEVKTKRASEWRMVIVINKALMALMKAHLAFIKLLSGLVENNIRSPLKAIKCLIHQFLVGI